MVVVDGGNVQHHVTRNPSVDEIAERYRLNLAIVVQAAFQAVVCGMMCLQEACKLLARPNRKHIIVLSIVL